MTSLLTDDDFNSLPEEAELRFVAIEKLAREAMNRLTPSADGLFDQRVQVEYMAVVSAAAEQLGIPYVSFPQPEHEERPTDYLDDFLARAISASTKIRVNPAYSSQPGSVRLSNRGRALIELQVQALRDVLESADGLTDPQRKSLLSKVDQLVEELRKPRSNLGQVMLQLATIGALTLNSVSLLANAPRAIDTIKSMVAEITVLIGLEKQTEDAAIQRLTGPSKPKALPSPLPRSSNTKRTEAIIDDDIPF